MRRSPVAPASFLRRPSAYPEGTRSVEVVQTHLSLLFLTDTRAYKLKRPVRLDVLDLRTVEARRRNCLEEVRLNRRLAPDVYLGVVPLVHSPLGLSLGGHGEALDWLVVMRRLPAERMLDRRIREGRLKDADVRRVARHLARFYRDAPPAEDGPAYRRRLEREVARDAAALSAPRYGLRRSLVEGVTCALREALTDQGPLLAARAGGGHVVEGHGDLRPEHVCLERAPVVIDCLEFSRELRIVDALDELSFLALECERLGAPEVGPLLLGEYARLTGDPAPSGLVELYQAFRACRRAKIAVWHLDDPEIDGSARWRRRAADYLGRASRRLERLAA